MKNINQLKLQEIDRQIEQILESPATSLWLRDLIRAALKRDCVDVANELEWLSELMSARANAMIESALGDDDAKA